MKTNIYFIILFLLVALPVSSAKAQPEAEFIEIVKEFTLLADGGSEMRYKKELKLLTHRSMNSMYGETFIIYDPRFQEIKFHDGYTRQADGTIMKLPANAFNEVLPSAAANAPAWNYLKEMVVTHTGLELGATIYLDYSLLTKAGYHNYLDIAESLQELSPVGKYTVTVSVPAGTVANWSVKGLPGAVNLSEKDGMDVYSWNFKNIPASPREILEPVMAGYKPYFCFNTYSSQQESFAFHQFNAKITGKVLDKVSNRVEKSTGDGYIEAVRNFLLNDIGYNRLSIMECGKSVRTPEEVLHTGYGSAMEKAIVMHGLIGAANSPSEIAVLYPKGLQAGVYGLSPVKETGIITEYKQEKVFLSLSGNNIYTLPELTSRFAIYSVTGSGFAALDEGKDIAVTSQENNVEIAGESIESKGKNELSGVIRGNRLLPQAYMPEYSDTTKIKWDKSGYSKYTPVEQVANMANYRMLKLSSQRSGYFELPFVMEDNVIHHISLGDGIECKTQPGNINLANEAGTLTVSLALDGNRITISKYIKFNKSVFSPREYKGLKELMHGWFNPNMNTVILKKDNNTSHPD